MGFDIISVLLSFILSYLTANAGSYFLSGIILCVEGFVLCVRNLKGLKQIPEPISLFSLSWVFCIGLSAMKLSNLQEKWMNETWITFLLIFLSFYIVEKLSESRLPEISICPYNDTCADRMNVLPVIIALTLISVICFVTEAAILGYIPLFTKDTPHAYSYFHISGLHYFTVLFVLEPSFFVFYLLNGQKTKKRNIIASICTTVCLILPILLVSRFQLLFGIIAAAFTFLTLKGSDLSEYITGRNILIALSGIILLVLCYVFITIERAHSVEYLNGIFEMKTSNMPIFITQPYIYAANNFDNFNQLIKNLPEHSHGLKQLFPFFALTGLKFRFPGLVDFPLYVTKEELTTVTMFYDAYYDFGIPGCVLLSSLLGFLYALIGKLLKIRKTPGFSVIAAQLYSYLFLAFFTTWFSNPTTWFYFFICIAIEALLCYFTCNKTKKGNESNE